MNAIRETVFKSIRSNIYTACIFTDMDGVLSGVDNARSKAEELGLAVDYCGEEGELLAAHDLVMQLRGTPEQLADAEDYIIGLLSKVSGIATSARKFRKAAGNGIRVVCGSWKKYPYYFKADARKAVLTGGASIRISDDPMVYLDKNYVAMLGGIQNSLWAAEPIKDRKKVIQIRGRFEDGDIVREAMTAIHSGADIIYVDTGNIEDVRLVTEAVRPMLDAWETELGYRRVEIAFGGGVRYEDVEELRQLKVDIIGVGRAIIDAPLVDMRMEITGLDETTQEHRHDNYNLLDKSELMISNIELREGNLTELASIVAEELGINNDDVLVIDVRDGNVALDILQKQLDPRIFIGKEKSLIDRIGKIEGVIVSDKTEISSRGMLGWIAMDEEESETMFREMELGEANAANIRERISNRILVYPTGAEVESGEIEDTNTPLLLSKFEEAGFVAEKGEVLKDDLDLFTGKIRRSLDGGYGAVITTGGVGAENKDYSVESVLRLDPDASTPYIAKFKVGEGRHRKDGIRIAVGQVGLTTLVTLPGPNDEVALCADCLVEGISKGWSKELLAHKLAALLRTRLREKMSGHHHNMIEI